MRTFQKYLAALGVSAAIMAGAALEAALMGAAPSAAQIVSPSSAPVATANPSATIGLTQVNGTAPTVMTSDSAPALSQAITPTWTGLHIFSAGLRASAGSAGAPSMNFVGDTTTGFYGVGSGRVGFSNAGTAAWLLADRLIGTSSGSLCFSSSGSILSCDSGFSRISAGILGFGSGNGGSLAGGFQGGTGQIGSGTGLTLVAGELGFNKIAASGSAPGASGVKEEWVCGTNAGTAKKIAYAGTSTTPVTVIDNVGSGVTGC